jgi:hypothetical protein
MSPSKTVPQKVNDSNGQSPDQRHGGKKRADTDAARDERFDQQDASKPRRMSRETAERIPADPDPDDPASP